MSSSDNPSRNIRFSSSVRSFVKARLSPESYLGLQLTIGVVLFIAASWLFGGIAEDVMASDPLTVIDGKVSLWLHMHATPGFTRFMLAFTNLHGPLGVSIMALAIGAYLLIRKSWYWLLAFAVVIPGGVLLNVLMKYAFHRVRPSFDDPLLTLTTYSFPSGHASASTLFYGLIAAYLIAHVTTWNKRVLIVFAALIMVTLVGLSRMYLGVHYLSDVLAGMAEGIAWLALCLTAIDTFRLRRAMRPLIPAHD